MMISIVIAPHPPIIIPEIGKENLKRVKKTVEGMKVLGKRVKNNSPELILIITPHGLCAHKEPSVSSHPLLEGDFGQFGFPQIKISMETDLNFIETLKEVSVQKKYSLFFHEDSSNRSRSSDFLDHGAMVPLYYFLQSGIRVPVVHVAVGLQPYADLYRLGQVLLETSKVYSKNITVLVSGDLSHRLIPGAPAGYSKRGKEFDQALIRLLKNGDKEGILNMDSSLIHEAGECGLGPIIVALGMAADDSFKADIISYEGPFGVGYLTAEIVKLDKNGDDKDHNIPIKNVLKRDSDFNPVSLARVALKYYFDKGKLPPLPDSLPGSYNKKSGAFVSLKLDGELRGCIGTVEPTRKSLADEIMENAISAALRDPRFAPVKPEELDSLSITVDVLGPLEKVDNRADLDPEVFGVLVRSGRRSGLLLPNLEGVDSVEKQVGIACQKAGIVPGEPVKMFRFKVDRYYEQQ